MSNRNFSTSQNGYKLSFSEGHLQPLNISAKNSPLLAKIVVKAIGIKLVVKFAAGDTTTKFEKVKLLCVEIIV